MHFMPHPLPWVYSGFDKVRCQWPVYRGKVPCQIYTRLPFIDLHTGGIMCQCRKSWVDTRQISYESM